MTFIEEYRKGLVTAESIHDRIDEWHRSEQDNVSLLEYLGMTEQQYSDWLRDPASLKALGPDAT